MPPHRPLDDMTDSLLRGAGVLGVAGALAFGSVTLFLLIPELDFAVRSFCYVAAPIMGIASFGFAGLAAYHLMQAFIKIEQLMWPSGSHRMQAIVAFGVSCIIAISVVGLFAAALRSFSLTVGAS